MISAKENVIEFIDQIYAISIWQLQQMPYELYLQTEHWKHFRGEALKFYQNKCQTCGKVKVLDVHHRNYENRGRETFNDVELLCDGCHGKFHNKAS